MFQGRFREFQRYLKEVQRVFQRYFKEVSRVLKECLHCVLRKFQKVSRVFQKCFNKVVVLKFCCCMALIAAARAEGGLVCFKKEVFLEFCPGKKETRLHYCQLLSCAKLSTN